jgi:hypothetical protein
MRATPLAVVAGGVHGVAADFKHIDLTPFQSTECCPIILPHSDAHASPLFNHPSDLGNRPSRPDVFLALPVTRTVQPPILNIST